MTKLFNLDNLLEIFLSNEVIPKSESFRDPYGSYWLHNQDLGVKTAIHFGRIVDAIPYANTYKVQIDQQAPIWAATLSDTSLQPFGAKSINTYTIGTGVFLFWYRGCNWPFIIGAAPDYITENNLTRSDKLDGSSRSGFFVDRCHQAHLNLQNAIANFSCGRPTDSTQGEWGAISGTGICISLDDYMAQLRVDESTGVTAFYHDQLLRLAGHNLQTRSALRDREEIDDQNELSMYEGSSPYIWERLGAWTSGDTVHRELTHTEVSKNPEYGRFEPKYDDQQAFSRHLKFGGYLGQIKQELVAIPPIPTPASGSINRYSVSKIFPGVFEEHVTMTGAWAVASAKRISIRKRPIISVPKQMIKPEDSRGDDESNYKAAGSLGTGSNHLIKGEPTTPVTSDEDCLIRAAAILDIGAFVFNWESKHQFYYHNLDWYLPEDSESTLCSALVVPNFANLATNQYLDAPAPVTVDVDHRYDNTGGVKYWPTEAGIDILDDGSVVITDAWGSEIRMTGGQVFISSPGDIFLQSGRNVNCWAGRDFIAKAAWAVDLTASHKDIRLKAENNLMALAGNNGCGGILLESRASCPNYAFDPNVGEDAVHSGIFLKADNSRIVGWGGVIDLHSAVSDNLKGDITINSNDRRTQIRGKYIDNIAKKAIFDIFTDDAGNILNTHEWWSEASLVTSPLSIKGQLSVADDVEIDGWIRIVNGHVSSTLSGAYSGAIPEITDDTSITNNFSDIATRAGYLKTVMPDVVDIDGLAEISTTFDTVIFSLRTTSQYKTENFKLFESRWQQMARLSATIPAVWEEPVVYSSVVGQNDTYPYPGRDAWTGLESDQNILGSVTPTQLSWRTIDPTLVDTSTGVANDRGSIYETATYAVPDTDVLDGVYPIIINP